MTGGESAAAARREICPDEDALVAFVERRGNGREAIADHVDGCEACRELVAEFARHFLDDTVPAEGAFDPGEVEIEEGARVGRYRVVGRLGAGGMGVVFRAHDPELDRFVALKVVAAEISGADPQGARARLLREARALARLSHPNVVPAYDVGTLGSRIYVAMEHVEGETLGDWAAAPRDHREKIEVLVQAGRGLVAAHDVGLVHRDFKPGNVMVGRDGRVRVLDFGLARQDAGVEATVANGSIEATRTGALLGTPAYMAPEQWRGERVDARTDQFAFAVTAHEILTGERPFEGDTLHALRDAVLGGSVRLAPRVLPLPVRRALGRALSLDPNHRFPHLAELLAALEQPGSRAWPWAGVFAVAAAAAAVFALRPVALVAASSLAPASVPVVEAPSPVEAPVTKSAGVAQGEIDTTRGNGLAAGEVDARVTRPPPIDRPRPTSPSPPPAARGTVDLSDEALDDRQ
jgi:eukaryotic-like serine/threonine-protein kinase